MQRIVQGRYNLPDSRGRTSPERVGAESAQPVPFNLHEVKAFLSEDQLDRLLRGIWRKVNVLTKPFVATNAANGAISVLDAQPNRSYLFIQCQSGVGQLIGNFGRPPGAVGSIPADGIIIGAYPGFYEPLAVPSDQLWMAASAPNIPGFLIYALD